jgi:hypothetical protein
MPASRISAKVIFWRVACGIAHNRADRAGGEAPRGWAFAAWSRKLRGALREHRRTRFFKFDVDIVTTRRLLNALNKRAETH